LSHYEVQQVLSPKDESTTRTEFNMLLQFGRERGKSIECPEDGTQRLVKFDPYSSIVSAEMDMWRMSER